MLNELKNETVAAETLRRNLQDVLGDDAVLIADTIEGETNLHELIEAGIKQITFDQSLVAGLKEHQETLTDRKARIEDRVEAMRAALCSAMESAEIKKREFATGTISRKAVPPALVTDDEAQIPAKFWKPRDPVLDRSELTKALKNGETIPGCHLTNGSETISIRIK